jgi:signal transduction histidine kinase
MTDVQLVLLVDDDEDDYRLTRNLLLDIAHTRFALDWVDTFDRAVDEMKGARHDVFLVDYRLGKHNGLELLSQFARSRVPIIILTGEDDRAIDLQAMQLGAMDYLVKGQINAPLLERSIRYSIARKRTEEELRESRERLEERVKERTAELSRANERLQRADRLKDEFLAIMSHELRTPLTPIIGWSQILTERQHTPERLRKGIEIIRRNAELEARIVDDILDTSRIITGKLKLDFQLMDITEMLRLLVYSWTPIAARKGVTLTGDLEFSALVRGNGQRLQQVFSNLLSNAVKFTPAGGRITVSLRNADGAFQVSVADTGIGIKPDFLPHVFERFRQEDSSSTRKHGGLGLGLAIVRYIVEIHGGSIQVESEGEGHGARFTVKLPRASKNGDQLGLNSAA